MAQNNGGRGVAHHSVRAPLAVSRTLARQLPGRRPIIICGRPHGGSERHSHPIGQTTKYTWFAATLSRST